MLLLGARRGVPVVSLEEAARLAGAVAGVTGLAGTGALLTVADTRLTVRLTRDVWFDTERAAREQNEVFARLHRSQWA